jgi:hypothetical protein
VQEVCERQERERKKHGKIAPCVCSYTCACNCVYECFCFVLTDSAKHIHIYTRPKTLSTPSAHSNSSSPVRKARFIEFLRFFSHPSTSTFIMIVVTFYGCGKCSSTHLCNNQYIHITDI